MKPVLALSFLLAASACAPRALPPSNGDFSPGAEMARAFELRDRYDLPKPRANTAIYVSSTAVHHLYSEASTIAWRDEAGRWQWSQAIETGPGGLLPVKRELDSHETRMLSASDARSLERLIRNPQLYSGKVRRTGKTDVGTPVHVMSIVTPFGRTTVEWSGRLRGPSGKVADIVLGH